LSPGREKDKRRGSPAENKRRGSPENKRTLNRSNSPFGRKDK